MVQCVLCDAQCGTVEKMGRREDSYCLCRDPHITHPPTLHASFSTAHTTLPCHPATHPPCMPSPRQPTPPSHVTQPTTHPGLPSPRSHHPAMPPDHPTTLPAPSSTTHTTLPRQPACQPPTLACPLLNRALTLSGSESRTRLQSSRAEAGLPSFRRQAALHVGVLGGGGGRVYDL